MYYNDYMWQAGLFLGIFGVLLIAAGLWTRAGHDSLIWRPYLKPKGKNRKNELKVIGNWVAFVGIGLIVLGVILAVVPQ